MIKLNKFTLQLFAKKNEGVTAWNKTDGDDNEEIITIEIGGVKYQWPSSMFRQVGHTNKGKHDIKDNMVVALYAAAYQAHTGNNLFDFEKHKQHMLDFYDKHLINNPNDSPGDVAMLLAPNRNLLRDPTTGNIYMSNGKTGREQKFYSYSVTDGFSEEPVDIDTSKLVSTNNNYIQHVAFNELSAWAKEQGVDLEKYRDIATYSNSDSVLAHISDSSRSFQKGFNTSLTSGSAKFDGDSYQDWSRYQPQLQPGYDPELGVPIGKTNDDEYVYRNENGVPITADNKTAQTFFNNDGVEYNFDSSTGEWRGSDNQIYNPETGGQQQQSARDRAYDHFDFNAYYDDIMSTREGTFGGDALASITRQHEIDAANAALMADAAVQQQAIQQTRNVKAITDNLRAERMAQLRSGMNEAQLAEREIQMLMSQNQMINAQANQAAQESLQAHLMGQTAKEQAYAQWLETMAPYAQAGGAYHASSVGDLVAQAAKTKKGKEEGKITQGSLESMTTP